jgi:hypothetical protein
LQFKVSDKGRKIKEINNEIQGSLPSSPGKFILRYIDMNNNLIEPLGAWIKSSLSLKIVL